MIREGISHDGHVGPAEVIVDGADHSNDVEVRVSGRSLLTDSSSLHQFLVLRYV